MLGVLVAVPAHAIGTVPNAPTFVESEQVDAGVLGVIWDAPTYGGSSPITSYTATSLPDGLTCTTANTPPEVYCFVEGLTVGTSYTFTVVATNAVGDSLASDPSPPVTVAPFVVAGPPVNVGIYDSPYDGVDTGDVTWDIGSNTGPPVYGFIATASPGGQTCSSTGFACTLTGLSGAAYSVTVVAVNAAGPSAPSLPLTPIRFRVPEAPWDVTAVSVGSSSATVAWSGVSSSFGNDNDYIVTASPGGQTCVSLATVPAQLQPNRCVVLGLTAQTSYTFTVAARNVNGTGPSSAPSAAITTLVPAPPVAPPPPRVLPRPPQPVSALTVVGQLSADGTIGARLAWAGPIDMTSVRMGVATGVRRPGSTETLPGVVIAPTRTSAVVSGLRPGVTYTFAVYPVNAAGDVGQGSTAQVAGTTVRTTVAATSTAGQIVPVRFSLRDLGGHGLANKPVQVLVRPAVGGAWRVYRSLSTNALGEVLVRPRLTASTQFALRYQGEVNRAGVAAGGAVTVRVRASVSASLKVGNVIGLHTARRGTRATLTGLVGPNKRGQRVYLQKLVGTVWKNVAVTTLGTTSNCGFVLPTTARGTATYRVLRPADATNSSGVSASQVLTVL